MTNEAEADLPGSEGKLGACQLGLFLGMSLSFMAILSLILPTLLAAFVTLNIYLGWRSSGLEVFGSQPKPVSATALQFIPTGVLAAIPTNIPESTLTSTPTPLPTVSPLDKQVATLAALAAGIAVSGLQAPSPPKSLAQATPNMEIALASDAPQELANSLALRLVHSFVPVAIARPPVIPTTVSAASLIDTTQEFIPQMPSANSYDLIPLEGQRENRPAAEHGDLNLKLRGLQPIEADLTLVDITGSGLDPDAPNLSAIFKPDFVRAYAVYDWDWSCNCKGKWLQEDHLVLLGIRTTPGEPLFIPPRKQNVYVGKYYATVLYASEDSLTFVYTRAGSVATGYTVHYLGLHTDPNLVALFRQSKGNELPGLTLDTPIGVATAELIVAIRDNGTFLDARSKRDWWE
jgi:hypothetical protein